MRGAYRFFDAGFVLETDSASFADRFDRAYGAFRTTEEIDGPVYRLALAGRPVFVLDGESYTSADPEALSLYAYNMILNAAAARVRSHFLFHAAALAAPGGAGVILCGGGGLGKTTLALALLARGWRLFSDDVAAVGRLDGRLHPFPRQLAVRTPGGRPGEKALLDAAEIAPESAPPPEGCAARFLFLLEDQGGPARDPTIWYLLPERLDARLLAELPAVDGVRAVEVIAGEPAPALQVVLAPGAWPGVEPEIRALHRRHGVLLFEISRGPENAPDFSGAPEITPVAATEAATALLGHLKGGPQSALLREAFGGSAARLYLALAELAGGMACRRLRVGRLDEMVAAIEAAAQQDADER